MLVYFLLECRIDWILVCKLWQTLIYPRQTDVYCVHTLWDTEEKRSSFHLPSLLDFTFIPLFSPTPLGKPLLTALKERDKNEKSKCTWNVLVGEHLPLWSTATLLDNGSPRISISLFLLGSALPALTGKKAISFIHCYKRNFTFFDHIFTLLYT